MPRDSQSSKTMTMGVLGGMGPESTAIFFRKIIEFTPAQRDQDHIPVLIFNNPLTPDRTEAILNNGESPVSALKEGIALLEHGGVDFISIPCNTAHYWYHELQQSSRLPILNMIDLVVTEAYQLNPSMKQIAVLATNGTVKSRLYHDAFERVEVKVVTPDDGKQKELQSLIQSLKNNQPRRSGDINTVVNELIDRGAEAVVLGCTELSLIISELTPHVPVLDSTEILARKSVKLALRQEPLPVV